MISGILYHTRQTEEAERLKKAIGAVVLWLVMGILSDLLAHSLNPSMIIIAALGVSISAGALSFVVRRPEVAAIMIGMAMWSIWLSPLKMVDRLLLPLTELLLGVIIAWWSQRAEIGRLRPRDGFLGFIILILVSMALSVSLLVSHPTTLSTNLSLLLAAYLLTPPTEVLIVLMILTRHHLTRSFLRCHYQWNAKTLPLVGWGITIGIMMSVITALVVEWEIKAAHIRIRSNNPFVFAKGLNGHLGLIAFLMIVAIVIMAPVAEEILFRGILFGTLQPAWGLGWATVVAGFLFGVAHMNLTLLIPLALAGMILNLVYWKTGSLIPSTIAHATLNLLSVVIALLALH
ncbi:CPBP family intramembrane glutamic endopeptidase [Sulfobacillus thermosulfidooxidans]|uniref:CPBP family intramembrane glutamic endopeptidase n=1 Tax=Sulfobacillus thermosulfidooxidans TaxID=28034 RepID=UPI0009EA4517|nr:CPBP family intramembrane glutamic endopeptidase [Sulfobacillus thermosulfidooxidans]